MQRQALVEIGPDKRIRLTKKGLEGAEDIARRHRLAEWLVVKLLGMELYLAHNEAHRLEHGMSREFQERLMDRLGYPTRSPFGRPIPNSLTTNLSGNVVRCLLPHTHEYPTGAVVDVSLRDGHPLRPLREPASLLTGL